MKKSIFIKVFGGYVILLLLLSAVFLLFSFRTIKRYYLDTLAHDLENVARTLDARIFDYLDNNRLEELEGFLREDGKKIGARLTVIDPEGMVKADSEQNPSSMEGHRFRPEILEALEGRVGRSLRYSSTLRTRMLYVALPLERGRGVEGVLRLSLFVRDIDVLLNAIRGDIGRAVGIITVLAIFGAFVFSRSLTRPLGQLIRASRQVAAGDFSASVRVRRSDEWKDLATNFNAMTAEVKRLFDELRKSKEELGSTMASMEEGLLVLDGAGRIVLCNRSAKSIIGQEAPEGKYFWEMVRMTPFVDLVRRVKEEKKSLTDEFMFGDKSIFCRASYLPAQDGAVVTLYDVTEIQNLARIKKDFILNVSHEMRTPLTAIRGYAETLNGLADEKTRSYAETIIRHTDRLIRIVEDLVSLAALEEKGIAFETEKVNLKEMAENIIRIFEPGARDKGLDLRLEASANLPAVTGDPFRLEQMLINLVANAVRYTEKGGVQVRLNQEPGGVAVEVVDSGIGIPAEEQGRIFERFYVVDKSRSRQAGGTGLGLSIVKHIVELHGGKIDLKSTPGLGSTFRVFLPSSGPGESHQ
jgi:two-component system, OmpR family, phosphate regulon sensor histidine kinase PhoR